MPIRDPYYDWLDKSGNNYKPKDLRRTMCPECGNDLKFIVPSIIDDDYEENRYSRFMRHSSTEDRRSYQPSLILNDDTIIECLSCHNKFTYLDGRQAYVDQERDQIETSIVPSAAEIENPYILIDSNYSRETSLIVPITAYDFIHGEGIGGRGLKSLTCTINLRLPFSASRKALYFFDMPDLDYSESHRFNRRSNAPRQLETGIDEIDIPISISPEHLMQITRAMYRHHAFIESYANGEIEYEKIERSNEGVTNIPISMEEANHIAYSIQRIFEIGSTADGLRKNFSSNSFPFIIVMNENEEIVMGVPMKAGRIHKQIAKELQIPIIENMHNSPRDMYNWTNTAKERPGVLKFHGCTPYFSGGH